MSHPQPPTRQPNPTETEKYTKAVHYASLASVIIAPTLALLPPRKLDLYTLGLSALTIYSGNRLYRERYGRSLWDRQRRDPVNGDGNGTEGKTPAQLRNEAHRSSQAELLPTERAREFQRRYQLERANQSRRQGQGQGQPGAGTTGSSLHDLETDTAGQQPPSILERAYYGSENRDSWRADREREVQRKLADGKGYGDIIMDQIWEVWNWGKGEGKGGGDGKGKGGDDGEGGSSSGG